MPVWKQWKGRLLASCSLAVILLALLGWVARRPSSDTKTPPQPPGLPSVRTLLSKDRLIHWISFKGECTPCEFGNGTIEAVVGDGITLQFEFSEGSYAYLLAFDTDGMVTLLWPVDTDESEGEDIAPPKISRIDYPAPRPERVSFYRLNHSDKGGSQAFALILSATPLPAYREWERMVGELPWDGTADFANPWKNSGGRTRSTWNPTARWVRGEEEGHPPLLPLLRRLRNPDPTVEVYIWGFPVKPKID